MKRLIENYTFDHTQRTVTFNDYLSIDLEKILIITDVTRGTIIFNFACPGMTGRVTGNVLTLSYDTTPFASTDKLQVYIETLDANWNTYTQTINMNGTTPVAIAGTHIRSQFMYVVGNQSAVGNITLRVASGGTTLLTIQDGDNTSVSSSYTVPNGYTAYFIQGYASSNSKVSGYMDFKLLTRRYGGVFMIKGRTVCNDTGSSWWVYQYQISSLIPAKTDFKMVAVGGANNMIGMGGYELLLKKTE